MNIFMIQKYQSLLLYSAIVWLMHKPSFVYCQKTGGTTNITCIDTERGALLEFKLGLDIDSKSLLSDWSAENMDCCRWEGIKCSRNSRVTELNLGYDITIKYGLISGEIGSSLLGLPYLEFLDLSENMFYGKVSGFIGYLKRLRYLDLSQNKFYGKVPASIGSLKRLRYLKLSYNSFTGIVPHQLGNLSSLESLDLAYNWELEVESLAWISGLSFLNYLDISGVNLSSTTDWFESISSLPSLTTVWFLHCMLHSPSTLEHVNSTKILQLQTLYLSWNQLTSLTFLSNFISIKLLDISFNNLEGEIPSFFSTNFTSLIRLYASWNRLSNTTGFLQKGSSSLQDLYLDNNKLTGLFPDNLPTFPSLVKLDVSSNSFDGVLLEDNFINLTKLQVLDLSYNSISINLSTWRNPPFQLDVLKLSNCKLGPGFPQWLRTQSFLTELDISNTGVSEAIPTWFWNISSQLWYVNISRNSMNNKLPNYFPPQYSEVDLSFNQLYGALPSFSYQLMILDLSNNKFSGGISFLCSLEEVDLAYLGLQNNQLSGSLDSCWERLKNLRLLNLNNNNFSGYLPNSMGNLTVSLRNNNLYGELPSSQINFQSLMLLDLGENQLSGMIPTWIGTSLPLLAVLALHGNRFTGSIPRALCHLQSIKILDLSFNNFSGIIPSCLNNLSAMADKEINSLSIQFGDVYAHMYGYSVKYFTTWIAWKGLNREFVNKERVKLLTLIDLSNNVLSGSIPEELASLYLLVSLNLSKNSLTGIIPDNIGQLKMLESLDLSNNLLSGEIPKSMANFSSLSYLDLSANNLSGSIPLSTQLQSFNRNAFNNNPMLCGPPTTNPCHRNTSMPDTNVDHKAEDGIFHGDIWLYISIVVGFIVGFWGVCGTLLLNVSWRQRYFQVLNNWKEGLFVAILVGLSKMKRRLTS